MYVCMCVVVMSKSMVCYVNGTVDLFRFNFLKNRKEKRWWERENKIHNRTVWFLIK